MNRKTDKVRHILVALVLIAAVGGFSSCEKYSYPIPKVNPDITVHFETEIQPIFSSNCVSCHGGAQFPNLSEGKSYNALTKGGYVTLPGETSKLYHQLTTNSDHIPRTTDTEKLKILYWINQGALNN
jgi:hypothetical protein